MPNASSLWTLPCVSWLSLQSLQIHYQLYIQHSAHVRIPVQLATNPSGLYWLRKRFIRAHLETESWFAKSPASWSSGGSAEPITGSVLSSGPGLRPSCPPNAGVCRPGTLLAKSRQRSQKARALGTNSLCSCSPLPFLTRVTLGKSRHTSGFQCHL